MPSSDSPDAGGTDLSLRRRAGKEPERSSFAQTCSLLSQYFKERGALGVASKLEAANKAISDTSTAAPAPAATTMNLLPNVAVKSTEAVQGTTMNLLPNVAKSTVAAPGTTMNLLPNRVKSTEGQDLNTEPSSTPDLSLIAKLAAPSTSISMEDTVGKVEFRKPAERDPATAQMTIFYAGKVIVYNDFPADKARDIMVEAEKYANSYCVSRTHDVDKIKFSSAVVTDSNIVSTTEMKEPANKKQQPQANGSDLPIPIATRSSLHRFFSKRKDRAAAKAPEQVNGRTDSPPCDPGQSSNQWPDVEILEGQPPKSKQKIDLNL